MNTSSSMGPLGRPSHILIDWEKALINRNTEKLKTIESPFSGRDFGYVTPKTARQVTASQKPPARCNVKCRPHKPLAKPSRPSSQISDLVVLRSSTSATALKLSWRLRSPLTISRKALKCSSGRDQRNECFWGGGGPLDPYKITVILVNCLENRTWEGLPHAQASNALVPGQ